MRSYRLGYWSNIKNKAETTPYSPLRYTKGAHNRGRRERENTDIMFGTSAHLCQKRTYRWPCMEQNNQDDNHPRKPYDLKELVTQRVSKSTPARTHQPPASPAISIPLSGNVGVCYRLPLRLDLPNSWFSARHRVLRAWRLHSSCGIEPATRGAGQGRGTIGDRYPLIDGSRPAI